MSTSTQKGIEIAGIKDGVVILQNGGYRMILSVSTINFALKSEEEQNSLIFQYQSFLNSLHFPIQIVMQSRQLDLTPYLAKIESIKNKLTNELLKLQTEDYIDFISQLINVANIMKKNFYVVVEYQPISMGGGSILDKFIKRGEPAIMKISDQEFLRHKNELLERANIVASGLGGIGLHCVQLTTEEIIELFYKMYNPEVAGKERIENAEDLTAPMVEHSSERIEEASTPKKEEAVIDNSGIIEEAQKVRSQNEAKTAPKKNNEPQAPNKDNNQSAGQPTNTKPAQPQSISNNQPVNSETAQPVAPATQTTLNQANNIQGDQNAG